MKILCKSLLVAMVTSILASGCNERVAVASKPCSELANITDKAQRAELEKKCGRGGPAFKPTPKTREF